MGHLLIFLEQTQGRLNSSAYSAIQMAKEAQSFYQGKLFFLLVGSQSEQAAQEAAHYGADEIFVVSDIKFHSYLAETYAPLVIHIVKEQKISFIGAIATSLSKDLFPRVAGLLDTGSAMDIISIVGAHQFRRATHSGNLLQTIEVTGEPIVVTARQTSFSKAEPIVSDLAGVLSKITILSIPPVDSLGAEFVELKTQKQERPELTEAKIVVSGGRGLKEKQNFALLEQLCDLLGAALGASRAACDAGLVSNELQVGQTGKVVAPDLYIAIGISGAIQHIAGMKASKVIVAINKDPEAPIFQIADYGLVSTWEKAVPELIAEIKKIRGLQ